jgi:hypothetical protein
MKWRERHELFPAAEIILRSRCPGSKETAAKLEIVVRELLVKNERLRRELQMSGYPRSGSDAASLHEPLLIGISQTWNGKEIAMALGSKHVA